MPHLVPDRSSRISPPGTLLVHTTPDGTRMDLPLKAHPLFNLRKTIIAVALIGVVLCCNSLEYGRETLSGSAILLAISAVFSFLDLFWYAAKKARHPDEDPEWPQRRWMLGDALLAGLLQCVFWAAFAELTYRYSSNVTGAWGILADLLCSLLHVWCFWKQLMARCEKKALMKFQSQSCARCGYSIASDILEQQQPPNTVTYAGPSADFRNTTVLTPQGSESAMEEGLLGGSSSGKGYGSIDDYETMIEQPEEIVVGKGKKKAGRSSSGKAPERNAAPRETTSLME